MRPIAGKSRVSALLVGTASGLGQVALLRELMVLAGGSELSLGLVLAAWLLLGSLGAWAASFRARRPGRYRLAPLVLVGAGGLASLLLARAAPWLLGLPLGQALPLWSMAGLGLMALAPLALADGAAFPLLLAGARRDARPLSAGRLYGLETLGHALGALALVGLQAAGLNPVALLACGAFLAGVWGALLARGRTRAAARAGIWIWAAACLAVLVLSSPLDQLLRQWQWQGRQVVATRETPYAQMVVTRSGEQRDFFASGQWLFSLPRPRRAQREALPPLLANPTARSALFIGGAAEGSAALAARLGDLKRVEALELDPWLVAMAGKSHTAPPANLIITIADGRTWLARPGRRYDLAVVLTPLGSTMQANRYYTREGLAALARVLEPDGVAVLTLPGVEGMIGRLQARRLGSILAAARAAFSQVVPMSGPELRVFLSNNNGPLTRDPAVWQQRLAARHWPDLAELTPRVLAQELMPFNLARLEAVVDQAGPHQPNLDFTPRALLWDANLWGSGLGGLSNVALALGDLRPAHLLWPLGALAAAAWLWGIRPRRSRPRPRLGPGVFAAGLSSMSLSLLLIMIHQALFGAAYLGLAWLLAAFLLGIALAALWAAGPRSARSAWRPVPLLAALAGACLLTWGVAWLLQETQASPAWAWVLALVAALDGGLAGAYFSAAARRRELAAMVHPGARTRDAAGRGGWLYALDLAGGVLGALLPVCLLPTIGLGPTLASLALLNLAAAGAGR